MTVPTIKGQCHSCFKSNVVLIINKKFGVPWCKDCSEITL